jgi:hypothetical protein
VVSIHSPSFDELDRRKTAERRQRDEKAILQDAERLTASRKHGGFKCTEARVR